jgi:hypothetical protein
MMFLITDVAPKTQYMSPLRGLDDSSCIYATDMSPLWGCFDSSRSQHHSLTILINAHHAHAPGIQPPAYSVFQRALAGNLPISLKIWLCPV